MLLEFMFPPNHFSPKFLSKCKLGEKNYCRVFTDYMKGTTYHRRYRYILFLTWKEYVLFLQYNLKSLDILPFIPSSIYRYELMRELCLNAWCIVRIRLELKFSNFKIKRKPNTCDFLHGVAVKHTIAGRQKVCCPSLQHC